MRKTLFFMFVMLMTLTVSAQLGQTRSEIIKEMGYNYSTGVADDGSPYIYYTRSMTTQASGTYTQYKCIYFITNEDGDRICYTWRVIEPDTEAKSNIVYYRSRYVEIGNLRWKDYTIDVIYDIIIKDGLCSITAWYESSK